MNYLVAVIDKYDREILQMSFKVLNDARNFAKAAVKGFKVKHTLIYDNVNDVKRIEGYQLDDEGDPQWMVF